ncbi:hypothetical protein BOX15_Mlig028660g2, partial [Macrostomum lignano]
RSQLLKVILLGDGGVGKSSLMTRYVQQRFDPHQHHTIGVEFLVKEVSLSDGSRYTLQIWDTAGQERFRSLRTPFYRGADACMLVYSLEDSKSFANLNIWRQEFFHYSGVESGEFPFLLVGNKSDSERAAVPADQAEAWATELDMPHLLTSAKSAHNVDQAFEQLTSLWAKRQLIGLARGGSADQDNDNEVRDVGTVRIRRGGGESAAGSVGGYRRRCCN